MKMNKKLKRQKQEIKKRQALKRENDRKKKNRQKYSNKKVVSQSVMRQKKFFFPQKNKKMKYFLFLHFYGIDYCIQCIVTEASN
jgi:hypothetical protein